ncbi:MAG: immunity 70 family protein [Deltaproteobacteria bacterium]|nr:immunity 70 family protein [Deltaproteobacteria bacterium]
MAVGLRVGSIVSEVGTADFLHAFFSTISRHLEPEGWGSRYPRLMKDLYHGKIKAGHAREALREVAEIREQLKAFAPDQVVWDIDHPAARPPWGDDISAEITDLSNYFVTSTGRDLIGMLVECLEFLEQQGGEMTVEKY